MKPGAACDEDPQPRPRLAAASEAPRPVSDTESSSRRERVPRVRTTHPSSSAARHARRPSRQCGSRGAPSRSERSTEYAGRGAGRPSSAVVIGRTRHSIPASSKIARASSNQLHSPSAATCQTPRSPRSTSPRAAAARWPDVGRAADLVVDDGDLVPFAPEPQHRAHEVVPGRPEEPRRADDQCVLARRALRVELRAPVGGERVRPGRTRRTASACARRRRSRSRRPTSGAPSSAACRVPPTFAAAAPCGSSSAPSTSVHAAA